LSRGFNLFFPKKEKKFKINFFSTRDIFRSFRDYFAGFLLVNHFELIGMPLFKKLIFKKKITLDLI